MKGLNLQVFLSASLVVCVICPMSAQPDSIVSEKIAVRARSARDSIMLRWAPTTYKTWRAGNALGYRVERFVIARDGKLLLKPEKVVLNRALVPWPVTQWEQLVNSDPYAAIAAQALYGDRFEVDLSQSDVFTIVNKVKENEQRFSFALFCADMSPAVAAASGLWFVDNTVKPRERYLYRIVANASDSLRGSIYIGPDDPRDLPAPQNLQADFKARTVHLKWDRTHLNTYTAFALERSSDGTEFQKVSDTPLATISPYETTDNRYEYASDSLPDPTKIWHYRVKGITPFGDTGPASNPVRGRGIALVESVPFITSAAGIDNTTIILEWDFPVTSNAAIRGFSVERAGSTHEKYKTLTKDLLEPARRNYEDIAPLKVNYYRVQAHGLDGKIYASHDYFSQLIDSIPPAPPIGLIAAVSDGGEIKLMWKPNQEKDTYGYRVYKAYTPTEEPAQVTTTPLLKPSFVDHVDLNTLNENVYYHVMALDNNQNHSALSEPLNVKLPDKVKPLAPVVLPVESDSSSIRIAWMPSGSEDVKTYLVYRKVASQDSWRLIATIPAEADSVFRFTDQDAAPEETNYYTVVSLDDAGLESDPAHPVAAMRSTHALAPAVKWKKPRMSRDNNLFTLEWEYHVPMIRYFRLYRSTDNLPPVLLVTLNGTVNEYADSVIPTHNYSYRVLAVFEDGRQSVMSDQLHLDY